MTDAEYIETQQQLLLLANIVSQMDLGGFLERISRAETAGPILDPTLYMRASRKLDAIKRIATAVKQLQKMVAEVKEELALDAYGGHEGAFDGCNAPDGEGRQCAI